MVRSNVNFPQMYLHIQYNHYQSPSSLFVEIDILTLKFTWKCKEPIIEFGGLILPDFRFYYKATVISSVGNWLKGKPRRLTEHKV